MAVERMMPPMAVAVVEVVFVETQRGSGVEGDPVRALNQYWSKDGRLLAEQDTKNAGYEGLIYLSPFSGRGRGMTPPAAETVIRIDADEATQKIKQVTRIIEKVSEYRKYLERVIATAEIVVHHKGALKAYRDALERCPAIEADPEAAA